MNPVVDFRSADTLTGYKQLDFEFDQRTQYLVFMDETKFAPLFQSGPCAGDIAVGIDN